MQISSRFTIAIHIFSCINTFEKEHKITSYRSCLELAGKNRISADEFHKSNAHRQPDIKKCRAPVEKV